jgi:DNA polymerase-1
VLEFSNGGRLVESMADLPFVPESIDELFLDVETTSCDDELDSLNPWHHCWLLGIAVTWDGVPGAWYLPLRHRHGGNLPLDAALDWVCAVAQRARRWVNHHVKYDAHVMANDGGIVTDGELFCTVVHSKLHDSDLQYRGGYGLDNLSTLWLGENIAGYEDKLKTYLHKRSDYGAVPREPMAQYACQDVITNRRLYKFLLSRRPSEVDQVAHMEIELTRVLWEMERNGLRIDQTELMIQELEVTQRMLDISDHLAERLGRVINPCSSDDVYDVLINQFGLPILAWTEENDEGEPVGNPSFNKHAMKQYAVHPLAPHDVVEEMAEYRQLSTFKSLFLQKYQALAVDEILRGSHNQCLRTGRMGCVEPNTQQLNKRAKKLIHPGAGEAFLSADQSQIEFRVIAHFINDEAVIRAYLENPDVDFHDWVKNVAHIARRPAKTMNFLMGYGGGKKKAIKTLSNDLEVVGGVVGRVDQLIAAGTIDESQRQEVFRALCEERGLAVFNEYHRTLPTLKPTSRRAAAVCRERGYVRTLYNRRRHLPADKSHVAFNSACQGTAADIQKERTVMMARAIRGTPIKMCANVHDETLLRGPIEIIEDRRTQCAVAWILEHSAIQLRVPLRVDVGTSRLHWAEASTGAKDGGPGRPIHYTPQERAWLESTPQEELFAWLRSENATSRERSTSTASVSTPSRS